MPCSSYADERKMPYPASQSYEVKVRGNLAVKELNTGLMAECTLHNIGHFKGSLMV